MTKYWTAMCLCALLAALPLKQAIAQSNTGGIRAGLLDPQMASLLQDMNLTFPEEMRDFKTYVVTQVQQGTFNPQQARLIIQGIFQQAVATHHADFIAAPAEDFRDLAFVSLKIATYLRDQGDVENCAAMTGSGAYNVNTARSIPPSLMVPLMTTTMKTIRDGRNRPPARRPITEADQVAFAQEFSARGGTPEMMAAMAGNSSVNLDVSKRCDLMVVALDTLAHSPPEVTATLLSGGR